MMPTCERQLIIFNIQFWLKQHNVFKKFFKVKYVNTLLNSKFFGILGRKQSLVERRAMDLNGLFINNK